MRLHDSKTGHFIRTKGSNCRIGFPDDEVDAWDKLRKDARTPTTEGVDPPDEE